MTTWTTPTEEAAALAVGANTAAVGLGVAAVTRRRLTPLGRLAGAGLALGGVRVLLALRPPRT